MYDLKAVKLIMADCSGKPRYESLITTCFNSNMATREAETSTTPVLLKGSYIPKASNLFNKIPLQNGVYYLFQNSWKFTALFRRNTKHMPELSNCHNVYVPY